MCPLGPSLIWGTGGPGAWRLGEAPPKRTRKAPGQDPSVLGAGAALPPGLPPTPVTSTSRWEHRDGRVSALSLSSPRGLARLARARNGTAAADPGPPRARPTALRSGRSACSGRPVGSGDTALRCGRLCSTGAKVREASVNYLQVTRIRHSHRHGLRNCVRRGNTAGKVIRPGFCASHGC